MTTIKDILEQPTCLWKQRQLYEHCIECDGRKSMARYFECQHYFTERDHKKINKEFETKIRSKIQDYNDSTVW